MKKYLILKKALFIIIGVMAIFVIMPFTGIKGLDDTAFAMTNTDCWRCHGCTPYFCGYSGNPDIDKTKTKHHLYYRVQNDDACTMCHYSSYWYDDCVACHTSGKACNITLTEPVDPNYNIHSNYKLAAHDKAPVDPGCSSAQCHGTNVVSEHNKYFSKYSYMCGLCHKIGSTLPSTFNLNQQNVMAAVTNGSGVSGQTVYCSDCHGAVADHLAAHDTTKIYYPSGIPGPDCTNCHDPNNALTEHNKYNVACAACHNTSPYQEVIQTAKKPDGSIAPVSCTACHISVDHAAAHTKIVYAVDDPYGLIKSGCTACHKTDALQEHSIYKVTCADCHNNPNSLIAAVIAKAPAPVQCSGCHDGVNHPSDVDKTAHDTTKIVFPTIPNITCTSTSCHATDAVTEHKKYNVYCYKCHTNNNLTKNNNLTYQQVISNAISNAPGTSPNTPVSCTDCHGSTPDHTAAHTPIPTTDTCAKCHGESLVTVHTNKGCNVCHNATYQPVIDQGKITPLTSCTNTSCHVGVNHATKHTPIPTTDTCAKCHGESLVTVHTNKGCNVCHNATYQPVIDQGKITPLTSCTNTSCHVGVNHATAHDNKVVIPYADCGSCHFTNVVTEHAKYNKTCSDCHNATYQVVMIKSIVYCADCHSSIRNFGNHVKQHDKTFMPAGVCTPSATDVVTHHESISTPTKPIYCFKCHTSTNSMVITAIDTGMAGNPVYCGNCHTGGCTPNQPPIAEAGPDQTVQVNASVSFSGAGSSDPDGTITSYAWNFGDGSTSTGVTTSHTYTTAGTYTVTLTVTDNMGSTGTDTAIVTVTAPLPTNLALKKSTSASGSESGYGSSNAVDGNMTTRWWKKSTSEQWIRVDLGSSMSISTVILKWHSYYAKDYYIETSTDGSSWSNVKSVSGSDGGTDQNTFSSKTARYVRVRCKAAYNYNGYSLYEFEVYK